MAKKPVGKVTHYYGKIGVAVVALNMALKQGQSIGKSNFFEQEAKSMEMWNEKVKAAKKGQEIGLKVDEKARKGDLVFKV